MGYVMLEKIICHPVPEGNMVSRIKPVYVNTDRITSVEAMDETYQRVIDSKFRMVEATAVVIDGEIEIRTKGTPEEIVKAIQEAAC